MRSVTLIRSVTSAATIAILLSGCGRGEESVTGDATRSAGTREATATTPDPLVGGPGDGANARGPSFGTPGSIFDTPPSDAAIARAREVLAKVGETYRAAPTLSDTLTLHSEQGPQAMRLRFDRNNERIVMALPSAAATILDSTLYMTNDLMYDLYLELEVEGDPAVAIAQHFNWVPPYHFAMRAPERPDGDAAADFYLNGIGLGILRNPRLRDYSLITDDDGRELHRLAIEAQAGGGHVFIDAESMLVTRIEMHILPPPGQPAHVRPSQFTVEANPVIADQLAEAITFDPGGRDRVTDPLSMAPRTLAAGDAAPNYRFRTRDGDVVRLKDLRGNVVVLDFWATWCVPCIQGLPHLDRFSNWAQEEGLPIRVFAINTMEQAEDFEERLASVEKFWDDREFGVPLVYDVESTAVARTGYPTIPLTLVIDPEGRITRVKDRFTRNMYQILKAEAERALREASAAEGQGGA